MNIRSISIKTLLSYINGDSEIKEFREDYKNKIQIDLLDGYVVITSNREKSLYNIIVINEQNVIMYNKYLYYNEIKFILNLLKVR